ncbi:MAG: hypothetical protein K8J31_03190, partial [Anaerolineae bacterium]|nr:hypothetical protein [Anaerolineae bacterium]
MGTRILNRHMRAANAQALTPNPLYALLRVQNNSQTKLRVIQIGLVSIDFLMVGLAFLVAYSLRFEGATSVLFDTGLMDTAFYQSTVIFLIPLWLVLFRIFRAYNPSILFSGHQEYTGIFNACTVGIMLVIAALFFDTQLVIARGWLVMGWIFSFGFVFIGRFAFRRFIYWSRSRGHFMTATYIVGANAEGVAIAEHLMSAPQHGINILGFLDDNLGVGEAVMPDVVVHGPTLRAEELCTKFGVERLIVATSGIDREDLQRMFKRFVNVDDVSVWLSSGMYEMLTTGVRVQDIGSMAMISVNRVRLTGINMIMKSAMDYIGAVLALI